MEYTDLQKRILLAAYQNNLNRQPIYLRGWAEEHGIQADMMWRAFDELDHNGLMKHLSSGGTVEITASGILKCEELGLPEPARFAQDTKMRTIMLDRVLRAQEQVGRKAYLSYEVSQPDPPFDEEQWDFNLAVLVGIGLLTRGMTMGTLAVTDYGMSVVHDWRKRSALASKLDDMEAAQPSERVLRFAQVIEELLTHQDWKVVSLHESGVLVQRFGQYYRVRCLAESEPAGSDTVNSFFMAIRQQPAVRGVLISWSGFTDEATRFAVANSAERPIILFDKDDIDTLLASKTDLDDLVQSKLDAIIHYHESHPQEMMRVTGSNPNDPEELQPFLRRFRQDNPDPSKCGFIMMRFDNTPTHTEIARVIKDTLQRFDLVGLRADDHTYTDDLFPNIRTYVHGCAFGIAVFERVTSNDFNPNISLEVGYMLGMDKPVCLLKDATLLSLHTDLVGRLYRNFDTQRIEDTLPRELETWLRDKNLIE